MQPTIDKYMEITKDSVKTEYQYILKAPVELKKSQRAEKLTFTSLETYYEPANMNLDISFYGLENDSKYYGDVSLPKDKDEITISYDFAQKMGLKR